MSKQLSVIAADINNEHKLAIGAAKTAIEHAHKAGQLLIEAKQDVEHGQWGEWVKSNCPFSEHTARKYMQLSKRALEADLGIDAALEQMAEPHMQFVMDSKKKGRVVDQITEILQLAEDVGILRDGELTPWDEKTDTSNMSDIERIVYLRKLARIIETKKVTDSIDRLYKRMINAPESARIAMYDAGTDLEKIRHVAFEMAAGRMDNSEYGATMLSVYKLSDSKTQWLIDDIARDMAGYFI